VNVVRPSPFNYGSGMRWFLLSVFALLGGVASLPAMAIVGGEFVSDEEYQAEFPWAVAVAKKDSREVCGGVLISPTWVLTAAHCAGKNRYVLTGNRKRSKSRRIDVAKVIRHPLRKGKSKDYDFGLFQLTEPIDATPLRVATNLETPKLIRKDASVEIAGWGSRPPRGTMSDELMRADIRLDSLVRARDKFQYNDPKAGPCVSDSGGPMTVRNDAGEKILVGIASATDGNLCPKGGGIAVYADVGAAADFIASYVRDLPRH
jgi:secreted trypsin-like serine protease